MATIEQRVHQLILRERAGMAPRNGREGYLYEIFVRDICTTIAYVAGVREHRLVLIIQGPHAIILSVGARIDGTLCI